MLHYIVASKTNNDKEMPEHFLVICLLYYNVFSALAVEVCNNGSPQN